MYISCFFLCHQILVVQEVSCVAGGGHWGDITVIFEVGAAVPP